MKLRHWFKFAELDFDFHDKKYKGIWLYERLKFETLENKILYMNLLLDEGRRANKNQYYTPLCLLDNHPDEINLARLEQRFKSWKQGKQEKQIMLLERN